jgi:hypothetical protein
MVLRFYIKLYKNFIRGLKVLKRLIATGKRKIMVLPIHSNLEAVFLTPVQGPTLISRGQNPSPPNILQIIPAASWLGHPALCGG